MRVYIPVTVHDEPAAPRSPRGLGAVVRFGLISEEDGPPEWREKIFACWWYRYSSFAYCVAGGLLVVRPIAPMYAQPCCGAFPFRAMGALIFVNCLLSYMADTHTFGRPSKWRAADSYIATFNTLLQFILVLLQVIGPMSFPRDMVCVFTASLLLALYCKRRAGRAFANRERDAYLRWHTAWHLILPAGAIIGMLLLD